MHPRVAMPVGNSLHTVGELRILRKVFIPRVMLWYRGRGMFFRHCGFKLSLIAGSLLVFRRTLKLLLIINAMLAVDLYQFILFQFEVKHIC